MADQQPTPDAGTPVPGPCPDGDAEGQSLGSWLRAQRLAHKWSGNEMGRRLGHAAKATGDHTIPGAAVLAAYVRRWERDKAGVTERYRLLYCHALGLPLSEFGPEPGWFGAAIPPPRPARAPHSPAPRLAAHGSVPLGLPAPYPDATSPVAVVIPEGCPPVVIHLARPGAASTPAYWPPPGGDQQNHHRQARYVHQPLLADDDYLAGLVTAALDQASDPAAILRTALRTPSTSPAPTAPAPSSSTTPTPTSYGRRA